MPLYYPRSNIFQSQLINKLNSTKATGLDGIGPRIIKLANNILAPSVSALIYKSIRMATFPGQLKWLRFIQYIKAAQILTQQNTDQSLFFQPYPKYLKKNNNISTHLVAFLNKYKIIHTNQSGFRQNHSCQLIDQWFTCIDDGDIVGTVFLDFKKVFDLVDNTLLLDKLALYKCNDAALNLLEVYVSNRQRVVDSGEGSSKPSIIKSGVPQGSILGTTFFFNIHKGSTPSSR